MPVRSFSFYGFHDQRERSSKRLTVVIARAGYQDNINGQRSLPTQLTNSNNTIEACLDACSKAGARVCGLEYCQFGRLPLLLVCKA